MTTATAAPVESEGGELTHRQILTILVGLLLGMFLAALDQTIVSTAIRTIADDLGGLSQQAWATTAFLITRTIATPLYGKLSDIYGRKPFFLIAISIFILGSVTCTFAQSMYQLAAFRALQGIGAGGLFSLALTILGDIVPPRERARYQGYFLAVFATSSVSGPVIGGLFAGRAHDPRHRRLALDLPRQRADRRGRAGRRRAVLNLPHTRRGPPHRLARRLTAGGRTRAAAARRRAGPRVGLGLRRVRRLLRARRTRAAAVRARRALVRRRRPAAAATVPQQRVLAGSAVGVLVGMAMFGGIAVLPQFLQIVRGASPIESGFLMLPLVAGIMTASLVVRPGHARTGRYKVFPVVGTLLMLGALVILHFRISVDIPFWELDLYMAMFGLGSGRLHADAGARGAERVARAGHGRGHGVVYVLPAARRHARHGHLLLDPVLHAPRQHRGRDDVGREDRPGVPGRGGRSRPCATTRPTRRSSRWPRAAAATCSTTRRSCRRSTPRLARPILEGFSNSITLVFLVAACVIAVGFVLVLFVRELPLRTMSGARAAAMEEAARTGEVPITVPAEAVPAGAPGSRRRGPGRDRAHIRRGSGRGRCGSGRDRAHRGCGRKRVPQARVGGTRSQAHPRPHRTAPPRSPRASRRGATPRQARRPAHRPPSGTPRRRQVAPDPHPAPATEPGTDGRSEPAATVAAGPGRLPVSASRSDDAPAAAGGLPVAASRLEDDADGWFATAAAEPVVDGPGVAGRATRADGQGLATVMVTVADPAGRQEARTTTDDEGRYAVALREAGTYLVVAAAGAYQPHAALVVVGPRRGHPARRHARGHVRGARRSSGTAGSRSSARPSR